MSNEEIITQQFYAVLRQDLKTFVRKVFQEVSPQSQYLDNWHIDLICSELIAMLRGKNNRLIINIPPRYMKSIICSVALPAFILGNFPQESVICVSYADDLAKKLAADCRRVMESAWYKRTFPCTRLALNRKELMDFETTQGGGRYSTTVGGPLTGRGGNWIIIDDPIKPADANSDLIRNKVNEWYGNTLYSRLNDKKNGKILLIMQRTHEQDLTGFLLESKAGFKRISIPLLALQEEHWEYKKYLGDKAFLYHATRQVGEPLHPAREGKEQIAQMKVAMGSMAFSCQCQQSPLAPDSNIVKWGWFKRYNKNVLLNPIHDENYPEIIRLEFSFDLALKTGRENDYSVCICALRAPNQTFILDIKRWKLELPDLVKTAQAYIDVQLQNCKVVNRYLGVRLLIEDVGCGTGFYQAMKPLRYRIDQIHPKEDKVTRLKNVTPLIERGVCLLPDKPEPWEADFKHEILGFPNAAHDDQVDALSQMLEVSVHKTFDFI